MEMVCSHWFSTALLLCVHSGIQSNTSINIDIISITVHATRPTPYMDRWASIEFAALFTHPLDQKQWEGTYNGRGGEGGGREGEEGEEQEEEKTQLSFLESGKPWKVNECGQRNRSRQQGISLHRNEQSEISYADWWERVRNTQGESGGETGEDLLWWSGGY